MTRASKGQYSQDDERPRRMQLWYLVSLLAASGLRSSALCSSVESSLRWGDIEETDVQVEVTRMSNDTRGSKRALLLKIRDATKTGRRTVSALVGHYIDRLRELNPKHTKPDDPLFCDFRGQPLPLFHLRLHWNDVVSQWGFDCFHLTFYTLRYPYTTEPLKRGVSVTLVSRALGTSTKNVENVYGHVIMSEEGMIRSLYATQ